MEEVKKGKKKNKVASLLLALALILTCGVAGTIAQYQKTIGGTSNTANVASFKVSATGDQGDTTFNVFKTIYDTDGKTTDGEVAPNKIAPGTSGVYPVTLTNDSEVTVSYSVKVERVSGGTIGSYTKESDGSTVAGGGTIPLMFALSNAADINSVQPSDWVSLDDIITNSKTVTKSGTLDYKGKVSGKSTESDYKIYWKWAYQGDNDLDTAIGDSIAKGDGNFTNPVMKVGVTFTQED